MSHTYRLNPRVRGLTCLRCGASYAVDDPVVDAEVGCERCLHAGFPASLCIAYAGPPRWDPQPNARGMLRYVNNLPFADFPTLGEGGTALVNLPALARDLDLAAVWAKTEGQNPTGSQKDRMSPLAVARAASMGYETVVAASSGNAGVSLAAYATAAGLRCVIISTTDINPIWQRAIEMTGADLVLTETPQQRWDYQQRQVENEGWFPVTNYLTPPVGSNPFGVQGYKSVAYEIVEQCGATRPTHIVVPTARGDLLWGIWQGLLDLQQAAVLEDLPRLVAVEPLARLSQVLAGADYRALFQGDAGDMVSIGGATATYQSMVALRDSRGLAIDVTPAKARQAQQALGRLGLYAELSSAASLAALWQLSERGEVGPADCVVLVVTSHGYKDRPA